MATLTPTTKLQAVNTMLSTIGEQPVSDLSTSGLADVALAIQILDEQNRRVQSRGWNFNTDWDWQIALDVNSKAAIPPDALRIDFKNASKDYVWRAGFLYDRDDQTFVLDAAPECDIVRYYEFEDIPESARYYITVKAARIFQKRVLGDDTILAFNDQEELEAKADFEDAHQDSDDSNFLRETTVAGIIGSGRNTTSFWS